MREANYRVTFWDGDACIFSMSDVKELIQKGKVKSFGYKMPQPASSGETIYSDDVVKVRFYKTSWGKNIYKYSVFESTAILTTSGNVVLSYSTDIDLALMLHSRYNNYTYIDDKFDPCNKE